MLFLLVITFGRWPWLQKSKGVTLAPGEEHSRGRKGERPTALNLGEGTVPSLLLGTQLPTGRGAPGCFGGTRGLGAQLPTGRGAPGRFGGTRGSGLGAGRLSVAELFYQVLFANWDLSSKLQERAKRVVLTRKSHGFCGQCVSGPGSQDPVIVRVPVQNPALAGRFLGTDTHLSQSQHRC